MTSPKVSELIQKGVNIPSPESLFVADEVDVDRISGEDVTIHAGCRILGTSTLVCKGAILGEEGPVTIKHCKIGPDVQLKGGFFKNAVFLKGASMGSGAHVREGTILEEKAGGAHTVGLKQTILFPYVTLGSLINFCDCLMAGGTDEKNHSEVGSSYIHFNFTPNQDKATASLIGDVPRGVMLNQQPIFLGGQGGLVGPSRLSYGTVIAAGSIYRKDELRPGRLIAEGSGRSVNVPHSEGFYRSIKRIAQNNILYIANLVSLGEWYKHVRGRFISKDFPEALYGGLLENLETAKTERLKRFGQLAEKMSDSVKIYREFTKDNRSEKLLKQKTELYDKWPELEAALKRSIGEGDVKNTRDEFLAGLDNRVETYGKDYLYVIKKLDNNEHDLGTEWLQEIVNEVARRAYDMLPSLGLKKPE